MAPSPFLPFFDFFLSLFEPFEFELELPIKPAGVCGLVSGAILLFTSLLALLRSSTVPSWRSYECVNVENSSGSDLRDLPIQMVSGMLFKPLRSLTSKRRLVNSAMWQWMLPLALNWSREIISKTLTSRKVDLSLKFFSKALHLSAALVRWRTRWSSGSIIEGRSIFNAARLSLSDF